MREREMSASDDLIDQLERETGQRIDDNDGDNFAMAGLFGAIARVMGQSPSSYTERDDIAAGVLIRHRMSPEGKREEETDQMIAQLLATGMSPDDIKELLG